jgi:two-component system sensor histidine kinase UhpB
MWQLLSLRARLNMLFASILLIGLVANVTKLLLEAGPRVQAEDQSVTRLADEFAHAMLSDLDRSDTVEADARITRTFEGLRRLRHVTVVREGGVPQAPNRSDDLEKEVAAQRLPPAWFVALVQPEKTTIRIPLAVQGNDMGALVISSEPLDEISEIWDGILTQIVVGGCIAVMILLITAAVVRRALTPLGSLSAAMARVETGDYATRVALAGPSELAAICGQLNHLVLVLGQAMEERRQLAGRIVSLQDTERKEVARELHDEFGPYLFTLRAHLASLESAIGSRNANPATLLRQCRAMTEQLSALQQVNRQVLERLRPVALADLGLGEALRALVRMWREANPAVEIEIKMSDSLGVIDERAELTIYRVVQEALTNVFRHAGATSVEIVIEPTAKGLGVNDCQQAVRVEVKDNGVGLRVDHRSGFGTVGMRERVIALGGRVDMQSTPAGAVIEALIPRGSAD